MRLNSASTSIAVSLLVVLLLFARSHAALLMHFDPNLPSTMFEDGNTTGGTDPIDPPYVDEVIRWMDSTVNNFDIQQAFAGPILAEGPGPDSPYVLSFSGGGQNLLALDSNAGNIVSPESELNLDTLTIVLVGNAGVAGTETGTFINFNYDVGGPDLVSLEYDYGSGSVVGRASGGTVSKKVTPGTWFVAELAWDSGNGVSLSVNGVSAGTSPSAAVPDADFDRFRFGRKASNSGTLNGLIGDVYIYDTASEDTGSLVSQLISDYPNVAVPVLSINRSTGELTLSHQGASMTVVGYRITSTSGALDPGAWNSIAESYDQPSGLTPGDGSVDPNDEWLELTAASARTDLSEFEPDGDGAVIVNNESIDLGNAWIKNPNEDVLCQLLLSDGTVQDIAVVFSGNEGEPFPFGDLDFDGDFDVQDFKNGFVPHYLNDTSTLSSAERYQVGDFNEDGQTDFVDFFIYNQAYLDANPGAAPLSLAVPEPSGIVLAGLACALCALCCCRRQFVGGSRIAFMTASYIGLIVVAASPAQAELVAQFDPNVISTMFQDGNVAGGTVPVTGVGDPVRWMTDVRSPTPGGGSLDGFIDVQQAGTGATLVDSLGGTILSFAGNGNLLGFDDDIGGTIDGTNGDFDSNTLTLIMVGQANEGGTGIDTFIDFRSDNPNADAIKGFGLQYDHDLGQLQGVVQGAAVAGTSLATGQLFVSTLTWNGAASTASLRVTTLVNQISQTTTTNDSASDVPIDHDRFRLARTADSAAASSLDGLIGDLYLYNDALSHTDVHDQLASNYVIEPDLLSLVVNRTTGHVELQNNSPVPITIDGYRITSNLDSLDAQMWSSLEDSDYDGSSGNPVWAELGAVPHELSEGYFGGSSSIPNGASINLGFPYNETIDGQDLLFEFHVAGTDLKFLNGNISYITGGTLPGDYDNDGDVDGRDFLVWQRQLGSGVPNPGDGADGNNNGVVDQADLVVWQQNYGSNSGLQAATTSVPEPTSGALMAIMILIVGCLKGRAQVDWRAVRLTPTRFYVRHIVISFRQSRLAKLAVIFLVVLPVVGVSKSFAVTTNDRWYKLGDDSAEAATSGIILGSGAGNVSPGQTLDSQGPTGAYVDLIVHGDPTYVDVSDRPGADTSSLGAAFDGEGDALTGFSVNAPDAMWDDETYFPSGYPLNYDSIFAHGIQLWAKPNAATQNVRQDLIVDTLEHGISINSSNEWALQYDDVLVDSSASVEFGQWTHVMQLAGFDDPVRGRSNAVGALYVNGVAVAARGSVYESGNTQLAIGSNQDATENYFHGDMDEVRIFLWGENVGHTNGGAGPNGQDWGTLNLATDNDWIQQELARRAALLSVPSIPQADVNLDGQVTGDGTGSVATDDVSAFIEFWNYQRLVDDIQVGDWISRQNGDLNYDGRTDLADAFLLRNALISGGGGSFSADLLESLLVPEPPSAFMLMIGTLICVKHTRGRAAVKASRVISRHK